MKLVASTALALVFAASSGWHVIGRSPSARGMIADVAAHATARRPHALAVRVIGGAGITGSAVVRCSRGRATRTAKTTYVGRFAGLRLPLQRPERCDVAARAAGTSQIRLEILAR